MTHQSNCFALVDCNNFYASCERIFRPDLKTTPIVVASNNDGCVIARSAEAKKLGIKMGVPLFKIKDLIKQFNVHVFSSNYALYGDISHRVMSVIEDNVPSIEIYSIDEAFADLSRMDNIDTLYALAQNIQSKVFAWTGIGVGIGIGPTKTLAKLANYAAKKYKATQGIVDLTSPDRQIKLMQITPVSDVWGVGSRLTEQLNSIGISTAYDLATAHKKALRRQFSVVLERTARELCGESCLQMEDISVKKQLIVSRSFGEKVTDIISIRSAIATFTARACAKLRAENQTALQLSVFIRTGVYSIKQPYTSESATYRFQVPTNDTREILNAARRLTDTIYRPGFLYAKAGVILTDFYDPGVYQQSLFTEQVERKNSKALMRVIDKLNTQRTNTLFFASEKANLKWVMQRDSLSPAYTTSWNDLPIAR